MLRKLITKGLKTENNLLRRLILVILFPFMFTIGMSLYLIEKFNEVWADSWKETVEIWHKPYRT